VNQLRTLRERMGLSQEGVARLIGVSVGQVSRWERGEMPPNESNRKRLAKLYQVGVDQLGLEEERRMGP